MRKMNITVLLKLLMLVPTSAFAWSADLIIVRGSEKTTITYKYVSHSEKNNTHHLEIDGPFSCDAILSRKPTPWDGIAKASPNFVMFFCNLKGQTDKTLAAMAPCPAGGGITIPDSKNQPVGVMVICNKH